jgi:light-regulated signal transduction histidine kinase (bacteriophytochrome)
LEALRASEDRLRVANEALVRANADLRHFSYAVSHDMQEPLRMVTIYTQLLARDYGKNLDAEAKAYMAHAVTGAGRMELLLNDLRDYWSVDQESETAVHRIASSQHSFERAVEFLEAEIAESGATVTRDPLPDIRADHYALTLLFKNLISNAIKYRKPETEPRVHVSAIRADGLCTFTVSDNGIGISAGSLEAVFAPFKRLHGKEYPGTGLGLAMSRKIVEKHNGRIWVDSTPGEGSQFRFALGNSNGTKGESAADSTDRR